MDKSLLPCMYRLAWIMSIAVLSWIGTPVVHAESAADCAELNSKLARLGQVVLDSVYLSGNCEIMSKRISGDKFIRNLSLNGVLAFKEPGTAGRLLIDKLDGEYGQIRFKDSPRIIISSGTLQDADLSRSRVQDAQGSLYLDFNTLTIRNTESARRYAILRDLFIGNLRGPLDLRESSIEYSPPNEATIEDVDLSRSLMGRSLNLSKLTFIRVNLDGIEFVDRASFTPPRNYTMATIDILAKKTLTQADIDSLGGLRNFSLNSRNLRGLNLTKQDVTGTDFISADLRGADLRGAKGLGSRPNALANAQLLGARICQTDLKKIFDGIKLLGNPGAHIQLLGFDIDPCGAAPTNLGADLRSYFMDALQKSSGKRQAELARAFWTSGLVHRLLIDESSMAPAWDIVRSEAVFTSLARHWDDRLFASATVRRATAESLCSEYDRLGTRLHQNPWASSLFLNLVLFEGLHVQAMQDLSDLAKRPNLNLTQTGIHAAVQAQKSCVAATKLTSPALLVPTPALYLRTILLNAAWKGIQEPMRASGRAHPNSPVPLVFWLTKAATEDGQGGFTECSETDVSCQIRIQGRANYINLDPLVSLILQTNILMDLSYAPALGQPLWAGLNQSFDHINDQVSQWSSRVPAALLRPFLERLGNLAEGGDGLVTLTSFSKLTSAADDFMLPTLIDLPGAYEMATITLSRPTLDPAFAVQRPILMMALAAGATHEVLPLNLLAGLADCLAITVPFESYVSFLKIFEAFRVSDLGTEADTTRFARERAQIGFALLEQGDLDLQGLVQTDFHSETQTLYGDLKLYLGTWAADFKNFYLLSYLSGEGLEQLGAVLSSMMNSPDDFVSRAEVYPLRSDAYYKINRHQLKEYLVANGSQTFTLNVSDHTALINEVCISCSWTAADSRVSKERSLSSRLAKKSHMALMLVDVKTPQVQRLVKRERVFAMGNAELTLADARKTALSHIHELDLVSPIIGEPTLFNQYRQSLWFLYATEPDSILASQEAHAAYQKQWSPTSLTQTSSIYDPTRIRDVDAMFNADATLRPILDQFN